MRSYFSLSLSSLTLALLLGAPRAAHTDGGGGVVVGISATAGLAIGGPMLIGGLITALHNGIVAERPTPAWRTSGYVFGGLNLAASVGWLAFSGTEGRADPKTLGLGLGFGISHLVIGGLGVGLTVAGARRPEIYVGMTPLMLADFRGRLTAGAGVQVAGF